MVRDDKHPERNRPAYNLKAVVKETGIKPPTLRAWERRYGFPNPARTEGGHRQYSQSDIDALRSEIADLRNRIDSIATTAEAAAQGASSAAARADASARAAAAAAADAKAASEKADRIYKQSLRK